MGVDRIGGGKTTKRKTQNQMDRPNYKGYRNERGKLGRNTRKQEVGEYRWLKISPKYSTHIFGCDLRMMMTILLETFNVN